MYVKCPFVILSSIMEALSVGESFYSSASDYTLNQKRETKVLSQSV